MGMMRWYDKLMLTFCDECCEDECDNNMMCDGMMHEMMNMNYEN